MLSINSLPARGTLRQYDYQQQLYTHEFVRVLQLQHAAPMFFYRLKLQEIRVNT